MSKHWILLLIAVLALGPLGCASGAGKGAAIGAAAGAVVGGAVSDNTVVGAIMGAAVGGVAGAIIGDYMDDQAEEMENLEGASVERVGEGIKITFDSGLLFAVNKASLSDEAKINLTRMAVVLNKYPDTEILIEGHTDDTGSEEYNQGLSERRANSVSDYLRREEVDVARMRTMGYGEMQPVADNATDAGRAANRRVEVAIWANEELKARAEAEAKEG